MARTLKEFVGELKRQVPIEDVIRDYLPGLRRRGRGYSAHCPFHEDKTPSFHVHPEGGIFRCFGCNVGGDAITFVQLYEKVDFRVAVESIARRFNIPVPAFGPGRSPEERQAEDHRRRRILDVCRLAQELFVDQLARHPRAAAAREYLERRGLTEAQIHQYRLGYAPPDAGALLAVARRRRFEPPQVAEAGLAVQGERGGFYDRFRDRIMIPIADANGETVGFGGRLLEGEGPKYLNSSDTPVFHKGRLVFGLAAAREAIRAEGRIVLVEGYMDWIALHSQGMANVVAGLGTAFTREQAQLLRRYAGEVILCYDGDPAGRKAAFSAARLILAQGVEARVVALPEGEDPDSYVRQSGVGALRQATTGAVAAIGYFLEAALRSHPVGTPQGRTAAFDEVRPLLEAVRDPVLREAWLVEVARRLGFDPASLARALRGRMRISPRQSAADGTPNEGTGPGASAGFDRLETFFLSRLLQVAHRREVFEGFDPEWFVDEVLRSVFSIVYESTRRPQEKAIPPAFWFSLIPEGPQREALVYILTVDARVADGSLPEESLFRTEEALVHECRELASRLRRRYRMRQRRRACHEARLSPEPPPELRASLFAQISADTQIVAMDSEHLAGGPGPSPLG